MNANESIEEERDKYMAVRILLSIVGLVIWTKPASVYVPGQLPETNIPVLLAWLLVIYNFERVWWMVWAIASFVSELIAPENPPVVDRSTTGGRQPLREGRQRSIEHQIRVPVPPTVASEDAQGGYYGNSTQPTQAPRTAHPARPTGDAVAKREIGTHPAVIAAPTAEIEIDEGKDEDREWFRERMAVTGTPEFPLAGSDHLLIVGGSGSGKTTTITRLAEEEVRRGSLVVAIDPHYQPGKWCRGIEIAGAARSASGPDMGEVKAVLELFVSKLRSRSFSAASGHVDTFRQLVLVIDEYQLVKEVVSAGVMTLLRESRKYGIRLVLGAHSKNVGALGFDGYGDLRDGLTILQLAGNGSGQPHTATVRHGLNREEASVIHPGGGWVPILPKLGPITSVHASAERAVNQVDSSGAIRALGAPPAPGEGFGEEMVKKQHGSNPGATRSNPEQPRSNQRVAPGATPEQPGSNPGATWEQPGSNPGATPEQPRSNLGATWEQPRSNPEQPRSNLGSLHNCP